jgi:hypothetical protein
VRLLPVEHGEGMLQLDDEVVVDEPRSIKPSFSSSCDQNTLREVVLDVGRVDAWVIEAMAMMVVVVETPGPRGSLERGRRAAG